MANQQPTGASYVFPAGHTEWTAPDQRRWKFRLIDKIICMFNLSLEPFLGASFVQHVSPDTHHFLAYEALNACSEASPSQDYSAMGVLLFPRLQHLNLHGFEVELEEELNTLSESRTTSKEQLERLRVLLRDYCKFLGHSPLLLGLKAS